MGKRDGTYFKTSTAAPLQLIWVANSPPIANQGMDDNE